MFERCLTLSVGAMSNVRYHFDIHFDGTHGHFDGIDEVVVEERKTV